MSNLVGTPSPAYTAWYDQQVHTHPWFYPGPASFGAGYTSTLRHIGMGLFGFPWLTPADLHPFNFEI